MPDPVTPEVTPQVVVEAVTPQIESPITAPVITPEAQPSSAVVAPVVTPETPPAVVVEPVIPVTEPVTVLATEIDKTTPKPVEPTPAPVEIQEQVLDSTKKTVEGQSDEPAPPPKYEPFVTPDDIKLDDQRVGEFTNILSELEIKGKADHTLIQEFGQKAVDFHIKEVRNILENRNKQQLADWEKTKTGWKDQFLADPEIGGNRFQTTIDSALTFLRTHGGTQEQQAEFRNLMETSGLGNHPAMIRLLAKAGAAMSEGTPLAATRPVPQLKSKTETMYGKRT